MENSQNQTPAIKAKKPFYKRWYGIIILSFGVLMVIGMIGSALESPEAKAKREQEFNSTQLLEQQKAESERTKPGVTMYNFEKISDKMSRVDVEILLNSSGKLSSSISFGKDIHATYDYKTEDFGFGLIIINYINDEVSSKSQIGL